MPDFEYIALTQDAKERLDKVLVKTMPGFSRSRIQQLIDFGYVLVNDEEVKRNTKVREDDIITAEYPEAESLEVVAEKMDLDILYEDRDLLVLNKPKGLVVHPGAGNPNHTLVNGLMYHCQDLSGINGIARPGIVHRIDKDTSGCLVIAKNDLAHHELSDQLQKRTLKRTYWALIHGVLEHNSGRIEAPIGRDKSDRQKMTVTAINSKAAITHFKVLERFKDMTLVECQLETGRTHQIRVHFQYIGYPLVGDLKYGLRQTLDTDGQCLHALAIDFIHPTTQEHMHFEAPLPAYLSTLLEKLRMGNAV
ncbi:MAG: 23S rRNA pseudouridine synthase [Erysipelotrichaceae bacterium]|nr:MAG: 23S rRNA pseudouridine [Erysipelotrichaceae bacterium]TXT16663.1 MAG: 23S rRNA pseudouridine synthase [Erysipelotrichaceae bacterium]